MGHARDSPGAVRQLDRRDAGPPRDDPRRGAGRDHRGPGTGRLGRRAPARGRVRKPDRQRRARGRDPARRATTLKQRLTCACAPSNVTRVSAFEAEVTVRRTRFANPESGWAVVEAAGADGTPIVLVGPLIHLEERERARVVGTWVHDSRYGRQVKVSEAQPLAPSDADADAVIAYLTRVKHIGAKRAERLVERYGAGHVFDAIDHD